MTWLLKGSPREAQIEALNRTKHQPYGFAYFMEMGLGKSATLLAEFMELKVNGMVDKLIITCPFSLTLNWANEVKNWCGDTLTVNVWPSTDLSADVQILYYEAYSVGGRKGEKYVRELLENHRCMNALDESTQIKNPNSVRTQSILGMARLSQYVRILSGAPMVQGIQDIWAQLKFIGELRGVNFYQFRNKYCVTGGFKGKQILGPRKEYVGEIHRLLDSCAFRAKKADWSDLPDKIMFTRRLQMSKEQQKEYDRMLDEFVAIIDDEIVEAHMIITQMVKLQQITSGFMYDENKIAHPFKGTNKKLQEVEDILESIDGKVIVVTYYRYTTELLLKKLEKYGVVGIYGGLNEIEIEQNKKEFNEGSARVILCQSTSAKYGHTLLGTQDQPCNTTIFYENSFSLDDRLQIEDRNHRIGQRFDVNIIDLVSSSIEEKVIKSLQRKEDMAKAIIDAIKSERNI